MESKLNSAEEPLMVAARDLADDLGRLRRRVVFAESCTGGLVSATMTQIPGISSWLCGSAVTYQDKTKSAWLDVSENDLNQFTSVSEQVTRVMAREVLLKTPQADFAVAVTGHLGPGAPSEIDGIVYVAGITRGPSDVAIRTSRIRLNMKDRRDRQIEAAENVLRYSRDLISDA